jgi:hypothetical protein
MLIYFSPMDKKFEKILHVLPLEILKTTYMHNGG